MPEPPPYPTTARGGHPGFPGGITAFGAALYLPHDLLVANPFTCAPTLPDRLGQGLSRMARRVRARCPNDVRAREETTPEAVVYRSRNSTKGMGVPEKAIRRELP